MAINKKFGSFGGVFTPSILTILGVIMYMRLPWIVGQAGLYTTLGIILVAHIISVTTGLSISSIATDKKVQAGGNYFIVSRSLGLPIGGTLGIALFIGLSFSVSLYIIGFSESFLGFWDIEITKNNIRIAGTLAVVAVTTITFISTSLAIKTQYLIMTAIGLSLASIFWGSSMPAPAQPLLSPAASAAPVMVLFGIFFPAVTGFEAGVSMSGDLRDPRKSIPAGTMSAIVVGLLVYLGLAVFFSFRVEPDQLVNNPNVLLEIAFFWPLVIAGIWGATLSSAMGSILGAPRILQATSSDRITPRIFAKGYGSLNEPRNALLLTFVIAEIGILVGELNIIARVVSIFFITAYGFLNLSCAIENWASTDFRPDFKMPTWISVIGSFVCFLVMIELDLLALIAAIIIMGSIFLFLKNKELTLESGDTWEGVWSSVIRSGLHYLKRGAGHRRNWRPNMILFSGGSVRPHLLELGKWIVHKRGLLSNFYLHENPDSKVLFSRSEQVLKYEDDFPGFFSRKMECRNIYEGMETIAQVYGFSGIDPNIVMMGWGRQAEKPDHYVRLLQKLISLDFNLLLLDFKASHDFGKRESVDIWWRGASNNISLALMLLKFLAASEEWLEARARLLIISEESDLINKMNKNAGKFLAEQRINASVKVINNAIERRPYAEIIKTESAGTDLIMLGMPDILPHNSARFLEDTNSLIDDLGTVLLVHASSYFEIPYIGFEDGAAKATLAEQTGTEESVVKLPDLVFPPQDNLAEHLKKFHALVESVLQEYRTGFLRTIQELNDGFLANLSSLVGKSFGALKDHLIEDDTPRFRKFLARIQSDMLFQSLGLLNEYRNRTVPTQVRNLEQGIDFTLSKLNKITDGVPRRIRIHYGLEYTEPQPGDSLYLRILKLRKRLNYRLFGRPVSLNVDFSNLADCFIAVQLRGAIYEHLKSFGSSSYRLISDIQKWFSVLRDGLIVLGKQLQQRELTADLIESGGRELVVRLQHIVERHRAESMEIHGELLRKNRSCIQQLYAELGDLEAGHKIRRQMRISKSSREMLPVIQGIPELWNKNLQLITNFSQLDLTLMMFTKRLDTIMERHINALLLSIDNNALSVLKELRGTLEAFAGELDSNSEASFRWAFDELNLFDGKSVVENLLTDLQAATEELPETLEIISEESFQQIDSQQFEEVEVVSVALKRLVDYLLETELVNPIGEEAAQTASDLKESLNTVHDVTRLICYTSTSSDEGEERDAANAEVALPTLVQNALKRFGEEEARIEQIRRDFSDTFQNRLSAVREKMNPYVLVHSARNLGQYMRTRESRIVRGKLGVKSQSIKNLITNILVHVWYRRSEGVLLAKKLREMESPRPGQTHILLNLVDYVSPSPAVLNSLPHFYRQLFLGRQPINPEFWVRRQTELANAEKAISRFRRGLRGALVIVGEPDSGKTSLCRMIALKTFDRDKIFTFFPPECGSVDPSVFYHHLFQALKSNDNREDIFRGIAPGSVVIINDLELWWERSPGGLAVVDEIAQLITKYSSRYLFMLNANVYSFRLINRMRSIEDLLLSIIECNPLNAEDLQSAILIRHESTGLQFELNGMPEGRISKFDYAKLFTRFFDYSAGNVGAVLQAWISHIESVEKERLTMRLPVRPDLRALEQLESDRVLWLLQIIIHKRLTTERLCRVFREEKSEVWRQLNILQRSGLVIEKSPDVYETNPFLQSFIIENLVQREVL
jgi:amino acid transporter